MHIDGMTTRRILKAGCPVKTRVPPRGYEFEIGEPGASGVAQVPPSMNVPTRANAETAGVTGFPVNVRAPTVAVVETTTMAGWPVSTRLPAEAFTGDV